VILQQVGSLLPLSFSDFKTEKICFIKLDDNESIRQEEFFISNYKYSTSFWNARNQVFMLNAIPGTYAAVAAYGTAFGGVPGSITRYYWIFFPSEMINETIVVANNGEMVYMGDYNLSMSSSTKNADDLQQYYVDMFSKNKKSLNLLGKLLFGFPYNNFLAPKLKSFDKSKDIEIKFLERQKSEFNNTDWTNHIEKRLQDLKNN